jgi:hypothetical protein
VIEKQDLEKVAVESTRTINIKEFIDEQELDPLFVGMSYYIAPDSINKRKKKGKDSSLLQLQPFKIELRIRALEYNDT